MRKKAESKKEEVKSVETKKEEDSKKGTGIPKNKKNVITFPTNINNYLTTVEDEKLKSRYKDYYINVLLQKTFAGQVKTKEDWKKAIDSLLNKNL